jgi:cytochrome c oxidase subunit 1
MGIQNTQLLITIAGFIIGISVLIAFMNIIYSAARGPVAAANPWRSRSPEFQLPSPIPVHNYAQPFAVVGEPYDYGLEGSAYVDIDHERYHHAPPTTPTQPATSPAGAD